MEKTNLNQPRYCNGGIKWFVINENKIHACHPIKEYKQTLFDICNNNLEIIRENEKCKLACNGGCEIGQCPMSNNKKSIVDENREITIVIYTSNYCPQDCPFCFHITTDKKKSWEVYIPGLIKLFSELDRIYPKHKYRILFTGGEPLLDNNIEEIINICAEKIDVCHFRIYTSIPYSQKIKKILENNKNIKKKLVISVSCHPGGKIFNLYKFIEGINFLKRENINFNVHMINHPVNSPFINGLKDTFISMKVNFFIAEDMESHNKSKILTNEIWSSISLDSDLMNYNFKKL